MKDTIPKIQMNIFTLRYQVEMISSLIPPPKVILTVRLASNANQL